VNRLPWIRVEDLTIAMTGQSLLQALTQNAASIVLDTRHDRTRQLNQSMTAAR